MLKNYFKDLEMELTNYHLGLEKMYLFPFFDSIGLRKLKASRLNLVLFQRAKVQLSR